MVPALIRRSSEGSRAGCAGVGGGSPAFATDAMVGVAVSVDVEVKKAVLVGSGVCVAGTNVDVGVANADVGVANISVGLGVQVGKKKRVRVGKKKKDVLVGEGAWVAVAGGFTVAVAWGADVLVGAGANVAVGGGAGVSVTIGAIVGVVPTWSNGNLGKPPFTAMDIRLRIISQMEKNLLIF